MHTFIKGTLFGVCLAVANNSGRALNGHIGRSKVDGLGARNERIVTMVPQVHKLGVADEVVVVRGRVSKLGVCHIERDACVMLITNINGCVVRAARERGVVERQIARVLRVDESIDGEDTVRNVVLVLGHFGGKLWVVGYNAR